MEKNNKWIVYLHVNKINKKVYVGITHFCSNPNRRWRDGNGYIGATFYNAILKYGWELFDHLVLCKTSKPLACILEQSLIRYYKNNNRSYNVGLGGEGSASFSEETKAKLRKYTPWIKGKHHTQDALAKISKASRERHPSEETRRKISEAHKGEKNPLFGRKYTREEIQLRANKIKKPVLQFTKQGEFITEFDSATDAERYLGVNGHHINCCCLGKRKTAYGYRWKYK